jgi:predicted nuclease with TOPRIM domain
MKHTGDYELDEINMLEQECADLEEENKRLENENIRLKSDIDAMLQNER